MSAPPLPFKGPVEGYVVNYLHGQHWRVQSTLTHLECLQEAYIVYDTCVRTYPDVEPRHFMALFKTSWHRRFTDLSVADTRSRATGLTLCTEDGAALDVVGELDNQGFLKTMIRQAPTEIKQVLSLLADCPSELLDLALAGWRQQGHRQKGGNSQVCAFLGLPPDSRPLDAVYDYFNSTSV